ncbi:MAG: hypothetical protein JO097_19240 [Acidobacteriaceae bacterium]|nr:hypothetical protein [Acidobacteriaceae bacterium]
MKFSALSRRALFAAAAVTVGALIAGCSGGSNSSMPTVTQSNSAPIVGAPPAGGERELARVTVNPNLHVTPVNNVAHALPVHGHAVFPIVWHGKPVNESCPGDSRCLIYHGGPVLFNTGSINVFINPDNNEVGGFPNTCSSGSCPPAQWGFPGGFIGRYSGDAEMGHILDQYVQPPGCCTRNDRYPYLGYITMIDNTIKADGTKANAASDATATAELKTAETAVGLVGSRYEYHLFYRQNQAFCSNQVGGCYLVNPFAFCAFHGDQTIGVNDTIYSIEPWQKIGGCEAPSQKLQDDTSSTLSHELTESLTDPHLDAWFSAGGEEIGDLCRNSYSTISMTPGPITYNIQQEWINSKGACAYGP